MSKFVSTMLSLSLMSLLSACGDRDTTPPLVSPSGTAPSAVDQSAVTDTGPPAGAVISAWVPSTPAPPPSELCSLDAINGTGAINGAFNASVSQGMTFEGWAATADAQDPHTVLLVLDGAVDFQITGSTGSPRSDVALAVGPSLAKAGFKIELPELNIPPGQYSVLVTGGGDSVSFVCNTKMVLIVG